MTTNPAANWKEPEVITAGPVLVDVEGHYATLDGRDLDLTPTEFDLLAVLAQNPRRVLSRAELADSTMRCSNASCERAIDAHIKNLRSKLGDDSRRPKYIQTVYGMGYRFRAGG